MIFNTISSVIPQISFAEEEDVVSSDTQLILHYDMKTIEENDEYIIKDVSTSGANYDGIFKNPENGNIINNSEVGYVSFNGGNSNSNSGYIEIPKSEDGSDLLSGLEDITVSALVNWENDGQNRWIFGLGRVDSDIEYGNGYFFATPQHGIDNRNIVATGISEGGWRNEALITGDKSLEAGAWEVVTTVFSGSTDTLTLYVNGEKVASESPKGKKLSQIIDSSASFSGFIGKSIFQVDPYYKGMIGDFRVYDGALTDEEIAGLFTETSNQIDQIDHLVINDAKDSLNITDYLGGNDESEEEITNNLLLPGKGKHGVNITWDSNDTEVINNDGTVTRPGLDESDRIVELTATLSYKELTVNKTFTVTVLKEYDDQQYVEIDASNIEVFNQENVKGNLRLPKVGENGSSITWESSNPDIIKGSEQAIEDPKLLGWVTRPEADSEVKLTATISYGDAEEEERNFDLTVKQAFEEKEYDAYFFSYFTGEYEGGEEISFATAEDPLKWRSLNNGQSVLQSTMGEKGLRDPFVMRSPEGDKFYMIATDLKMGESTNFDQAQITGSHSIMVWESDDLVNWSEQRMVEVAPKNGGNTWAPEAFYHEPTGEYVVFWASSMKPEDTYGDYHGRPNGQYNVMYYATTRDFHSFSEPQVFIDEGFPTIDTTFIEHDDTLYRFTKSENNMKVYYEKADDIFSDKDGIGENGFQFDPISGTKDGINGLIGHGGNNEGQTIFKDIHEDKWYLFLDSWPYHVRWTNDLEDGTQLVDNVLDDSEFALPPGPRHGTVMPITREEYDALQTKFGMTSAEPSEDPVVHYTFDSAKGTTVEDMSGNGYDAELIGGATIDTEDTVGESK